MELTRPPHALAGNSSSGIYWASGCSEGARCLLYGLSVPCSYSMPHVARRPGCWAAAPRGCSVLPPSSEAPGPNPSELTPLAWTLLPPQAPGLVESTAHCLNVSRAALTSTCPLPAAPPGSLLASTASRAALEGSHVRVAHVARDAASGRCVTSVALHAFQTPKHGVCFSARRPCCPRYERNVGHQAEILLPMIEAAVAARVAPSRVHWPFNLTHWAREVMSTLWPFTQLDTTPHASPHRHCRGFHPIGSNGGSRGWLRLPATAPLMRSAVLRHCGLSDAARRGAGRVSRRAVVLLREEAQDAEPRLFADFGSLLAHLRDALPGHVVDVRTTRSGAGLCEQAAWVAGASLVLSPHGAHLVNALWMDPNATLLEVMPWGMWEYLGYQSLFERSGLSYHRINASRPPDDAPHWRDPETGAQQRDELACFRDSSLRGRMAKSCRLFYRSKSELHVSSAQLCGALRQEQLASVGAVPELCRRVGSESGDSGVAGGLAAGMRL